MFKYTELDMNFFLLMPERKIQKLQPYHQIQISVTQTHHYKSNVGCESNNSVQYFLQYFAYKIASVNGEHGSNRSLRAGLCLQAMFCPDHCVLTLLCI